MSHSCKAGSINEFTASKAHCDTPYIPGEEGYVDRSNRNEGVHQTWPEGGYNGQRKQNVWKGHEHIDAAHDDIVDAPTKIPCHDPYA